MKIDKITGNVPNCTRQYSQVTKIKYHIIMCIIIIYKHMWNKFLKITIAYRFIIPTAFLNLRLPSQDIYSILYIS